MRYSNAALTVLSLFSLSTLAAVTAQAQVTLVLDNPNQTIAAPGTGSITVNFTGTVSFAAGYSSSNGGTLFVAYNASSSNYVLTQFNSLDLNLANNGGSVSGLLFTATVSSTTSPDYYGYQAFTLNPAYYSANATNDGGATNSTAFSNFSVTVTPAVTPEPGSAALLVGMGVTGAGFLARRRNTQSK